VAHWWRLTAASVPHQRLHEQDAIQQQAGCKLRQQNRVALRQREGGEDARRVAARAERGRRRSGIVETISPWDRPANTAARSSPVHACSRSLGLPTATAAADKRKAASWCTAQQSASKTAGRKHLRELPDGGGVSGDEEAPVAGRDSRGCCKDGEGPLRPARGWKGPRVSRRRQAGRPCRTEAAG